MHVSRLKTIGLAVLTVPVLMGGVMSPGFAQQAQTVPAKHPRLEAQLGLSPEQAEELKGIQEESRAKGQVLHQQARQKRQELMRYLNTPDAKPSTALKLQEELNDIQGRLGELRVKTWFQMREHLTAEQLQKMEQLRGPNDGARGFGRGSR